ncbi:MAG: HNH endonuclease [Microcoleus vaginatus WJT46-NPBG5]|nr:HNH endonuclease [Microcoleus vaginatus WJT46-NPBG5]
MKRSYPIVNYTKSKCENFTNFEQPALICELCEREVKHLTIHHLIPQQYIKRKKLSTSPTTNICSACHRQIHVLFDNKRLAEELNTLEQLKIEPQMQKFLAWVKKQTSSKRVKVNRRR